ncbi:Ig-like domain-containing protein [Paludisphaera rhizosphaerae]|nr:Ig-like domain-containing protein [Paludisphaera rhizosphaerae]
MDARLKRARKAHARQTVLEHLEPRTLLAILPAPQVAGSVAGISTTGGNVSSPTVVVDRYNPYHLVSIWVRNDPSLAPGNTTLVQGSYSNDGGATWTAMGSNIAGGGTQIDAAIAPSNGVFTRYTQTTNPLIAFDNSHHFYVLTQQSNASNSSGALVLQKFNFPGTGSGGTPTAVISNQIVRQWTTDPVLNPTLTVDDNQTSFTDPTSGATQTDPYAGNVWIGWTTQETTPTGIFNQNGSSWNANSIQVISSSDGGNTFSGAVKVNNLAGGSANAWGRWTSSAGVYAMATPKIVAAQGTSATAGGGATVVWDNFGRASNFTSDAIQATQVSGGYSYQAVYPIAGSSVPINQAITTSSGPYIVQTTDFPVNLTVDPTKFSSLSKLIVNLEIQQTDVSWLGAYLTAPAGVIDPATGQPVRILLFSPGMDASGTTPNPQNRGVTGANMGMAGTFGTAPNLIPYGEIPTTFDDGAARSVNDRSTAGAYTSTYRTEAFDQGANGYRSLQYLSTLGLTAAQVSGTWTLTIIANRNNGTNPGPVLRDFSITATSGAVANTTTFTVADSATKSVTDYTNVRGSLSGTFARASAAAGPQGIGPEISVAQDNTLGSYSQYQGRIYVTYVGYMNIRTSGQDNPADNTDIFLVTSDDGGVTWVNQGIVNDDQGSVDGYSGANKNTTLGQIVGRAQFLPQAAVDQATGTLVMSWRDGRDDSDRSRSAIYVAASLDGGGTFSAQSNASPTQTSIDAITGQTVVLNPAGDNFTGVSPAASAYGFGVQMGLAVGAGQVYVAWAGNQNRSTLDSSNNVIGRTFQTYVQRLTVAVGPRILGSTQGVVGQPGDVINTLRAADGSPVANSFVITFDRPVAVMTNANIAVFFKGTSNTSSYVSLPIVRVDPVDGSQVFTSQGVLIGYTMFKVVFDPWNGGSTSAYTNLVGTYSYAVIPSSTITDRIRRYNALGSLVTGNQIDENANGIAGESPFQVGYVSKTPGDYYLAPYPTRTSAVSWGSTITDLLTAPFSSMTLPLIVPGAHVASTSATNSTGSDNLVLNGTNSKMNLTFDRDILASSFTAADVLSIMGPTGSLLGPQYFASDKTGQSIPAPLSSSVAGTLLSTLTVPSYGGTFTAKNLTVTLNVTFPTASGLSVYLVAPNGTSLLLFSGVGGAGANFTNTTFSDSAAQSITSVTSAQAPFTGSYRPAGGSLATTFGNMSIDGAWTLRVVNSKTGSVGVLNSWSMSVTPNITVTPVGLVGLYARTFAIGFPMQSLSGTYTFQVAPTIVDRYGQAVDSNLNAGVDVLRGEAVNVPTTSVTYNSGTVNQSLVANTITSTINVPDNFLIQGTSATSGLSGLRLRLSLSTANVAPLTATLTYHPGQADQKTITLFTSLTQGPNTGGFVDAILDDNASTPISQSLPPYSAASFNPLTPLTTASGFLDLISGGAWQLKITSTGGTTATLNNWSLLFEKPLPTSGLGEPVADRISSSFRIFQSDPSNALSRNTWTSVGPATVSGSSGLIGAIAQDPSDPSGNTFFIGGATGGVWKTTNFLTTDSQGPTYIPLTDFGPTSGLNIGSIAVFGRNNDPNQSIVIASTGNADQGTTGVGFLISKDGGATWGLYDSTTNVDSSGNLLPISSPLRDRAFVGSTVFKVVVDPKATLTNQVIIYAAVSGNNGGLWRSLNTGATWQLMKAGDATDVILDPSSTGSGTDPNLQIVYAAFEGDGVYISPNKGQVWNLMAGGVGNPLIIDTRDNNNVAVANGTVNPNGAHGRIVLAKPALTGVALYDKIYAGWLYAAVSSPDGGFYGLFMTKDFGQNWVKVRIPTEPPLGGHVPAIPSNDIALNDYTITNGRGQEALSLAIDPTNPNIVYLGGYEAANSDTGIIRVDSTKIWDAQNLTTFSSVAADGQTDWSSTGPVTVDSIVNGWATRIPTVGFPIPSQQTYINYIRDPDNPFNATATRFAVGLGQFTNNGFGTEWIPFDAPLSIADTTTPTYNRLVTIVDPITGLPRLIYGSNRGVYSVLDDNGTQLVGTSVGTTPTPVADRNGNLQIAQFYYGAVQPNNAGTASSVDAALFAAAGNDGGQVSSSNVLNTGYLTWFQTSGGANSGGVAFDQQGTGTIYQSFQPGSMPLNLGTTFFQVDHTGRTFNLIQSSGNSTTPDPQWAPGPGATFTVNPLTGQQMIISSGTGRIFATTNQGQTWFQIGDPSVFGTPGGYSQALAYGAPDPTAPGGIGNLGNFMYVGTSSGRIFITQTGGGGTGNAWTESSTGLDGSSILRIVPSPTRGSHAAYAVTQVGVYYVADSLAANAAWINVTGNLRDIAYTIFGQNYDQSTDPNSTKLSQSLYLTAMVVDWRYSIPNSAADPVGSGLHPVLYVSANSGVYRSIDNGVTWTSFPNQSIDGSVADGGLLPRTSTTDLDLSLGAIDPNTGMSNLAGPYDPTSTSAADPDVLVATTWGRGMFAIRMAPVVVPGTVKLNPADTGGVDTSGNTIVTTSQFRVSGLSMATGFGDATRITIYDLTDGKVIGGFDKSLLSTNNAANWTDSFGNFTNLKVNAGAIPTNGLKVIQIYATDDAGAVGNVITLTINLQASDLGNSTVPADPTLSLLAADNTGIDPTQNYTNKSNPRFTGVTTAGSTVELKYKNSSGVYVSFSPAVTTTAGANGAFVLQIPTTPDGTYTVAAFASNAAGPANNPSPGVTFHIKTTAPTAPPTLILSSTTDSGIVGDGITNVRKPIFTGTVGAANAGSIIRIYQASSTGAPTGSVLAQVTANASGNYSVQLPLSLDNGVISLTATAVDPAGNPAPSNSSKLVTTIVTTGMDYSGSSFDYSGTVSKSQSQAILYLRNSSANSGQWFGRRTPPSLVPIWFPNGTKVGLVTDIPLAGDFDGDGKEDIVTYRPGDSTWVVWRSTQGGLVFKFGTANSSQPVVGNFDGPGASEYGVFDLVGGVGKWSLTSATGTVKNYTFGQTGDVPLVGDYLGLGYDQIAVYRPSTGQFIAFNRSTSTSSVVATLPANQVPAPGMYDNWISFKTNQPYKMIPAVFNPATGVFTIARLSGSPFPTTVVFKAGDIPSPADYAGVGYDIPGVYRPSTGQFLVKNDQLQSNGSDSQVAVFSAAGTPVVPVNSPLAYRQLSSSALIAGTSPVAQKASATASIMVAPAPTGDVVATTTTATTTTTTTTATTAPVVETTAPAASTTPVIQASSPVVLPSLSLAATTEKGASQPWFLGTTAPGATVELYLGKAGVAASKKVGTVVADASGGYTYQLPAGFRAGNYSLTAEILGADGSTTPVAAVTFQIAAAARLRTPVRGRFAQSTAAAIKAKAKAGAATAESSTSPQGVVVKSVVAASAAATTAAPLASDAFSQAIQSFDGVRLASMRKKRS